MGGQALFKSLPPVCVRIQVDIIFFQESFYDFYLLPLDVPCWCSILHRKSSSTSVKSDSPQYLPPFPILPKEHADLLFRLITFVKLWNWTEKYYNFLNFLLRQYRRHSIAHTQHSNTHSKYIFGAVHQEDGH